MLIVHHRVTKIDLHYHHTSSLPKSIVSATNFSRNGRFGVSQVRFTPSTMKSEHGRWTFSRIRLYDPTSMVRFVKWSLYNGPCTKNWMCWLFHTCPERAVLKNIQVWPLFLGFFFFTSLPFNFVFIVFTLNFSKHSCNGGDEEETYFVLKVIHVIIHACEACCGHSRIAFARRMGKVCNFELGLWIYGV